MPRMHFSMKTGRKFFRISIEKSELERHQRHHHVQLELPGLRRRNRSPSPAPMMWKQTWFMHSSIDGFTLPGMIEEPGLHGRQDDLRESGLRPGGEEAEVVRDARQLEREIAQRARRRRRPEAATASPRADRRLASRSRPVSSLRCRTTTWR